MLINKKFLTDRGSILRSAVSIVKMNSLPYLSQVYDLNSLMGQVDDGVVDLLFQTFRSETNDIPYDPRDWTPEHVYQWLSWANQNFNLFDLKLENFLDQYGGVIDGKSLCKLTKRNLCMKTSLVTGEILWKSLQTICRDYNETQKFKRMEAFAIEAKPTVAPVEEISTRPLSVDVVPDTKLTENAEDFLVQLIGFSSSMPSPGPSDTSDYESLSSPVPSITIDDLTPANSPVQPSVSSLPPRTSRKRGPKPLVKYTGNGPIQLWQFLLELLISEDHKGDADWTGEEPYEFKLNDPENVAKMWGKRKNKPKMNYEKLSRGLRYYYDKNIISKVHGKRYVYRFLCDIEKVLGYNPTPNPASPAKSDSEYKVPASPVDSLGSDTLLVDDSDSLYSGDSLFGDDLDDFFLNDLCAVVPDGDFSGLLA